MEKSKLHGQTLNMGEQAIDNAPRVTLENGQNCIPQHYLTYQHSRDSVEALVSDISYCPRYPIFISDDKGTLFLQIGIVGYDNYKSLQSQTGQKIVFGRKWRIEPNLPSSEVIQTAFLAIKKAREHEIRELFVLRRNGKSTTPFNNHQDLPLMARNQDLMENRVLGYKSKDIKASLKHISFDGGWFELIDVEALRSGPTAITLTYRTISETQYAMLSQSTFTFTLEHTDTNSLHHALMRELVAISDRHIEETFAYKDFKRFSTAVNVEAIADLSSEVRQAPKTLRKTDGDDYGFSNRFKTERYDTDITRIPQLTQSSYSQNLYAHLSDMELTNFDMLIKAQNKT